MEHAWESENVKPRALKAKAFASHGLTCVEIATGKPQSEIFPSIKTRFKVEAIHAAQR